MSTVQPNFSKLTPKYGIFITAALLCLLPVVSSPIALVLGFTLATFGVVPTQFNLAALTKKLLSYSIIGLGFGIQLDQAIEASKQGFGLIVASIFFTLVLGYVFTKLLRIEQKTGHLIASGTAICGGSAIAAVAPAINAKDDQTSLALATVFVLNAIALFIFPVIGHFFEMSQHAFGTWAAIAIHDTSSVVGAAGAYGDEALKTATTLKLARALWIIPIAFLSALMFKGNSKKVGVPFFILFYCIAIVVAYLLPNFQPFYSAVFSLSKRLLVVCLFLIGSGITIQKLRAAGIQPLLLGVLLWVCIGSSSFAYIQFFS
ncbi:YeiH family protein [Photobacterium sp. DNB23_23_1]|uniref:Sulfate exporter family transporter n=1 Tax=Photobacterium pectinilyticum TaxID=2906793 RepID=A0ABT1MWR8_9GAMM|nr:putative sulfate exporter family transporter [Photobacterium sp. ZSDE20]MCQ1056948.1 putative sulfate exporter family transporter [Photobacterium sp. ZSDE20]MDD1821083.1 putative sulfate exporter family transporter [Photobacterium sp. ZSDE20]